MARTAGVDNSLVLATLAAAVDMGQQEYENQLAHHLPELIPGVDVRRVRVRSMRSRLSGEARLPLGVVPKLPVLAGRLAARVAYGSPDLVHRSDLRLPPAANEIVTVHDLAALRFGDEGALATHAASTLRRARRVICPSRFAADELSDLLGVEDAMVIHNGLDPLVWTPSADAAAAAARLGVPPRFVLHSGGATARKNLGALAGAWRQVSDAQPDLALVLCGPADPRRDALFAGLPRTHLVGRIPRPEHLELMTAARAVVVPSLYEGFGFPALEAMARRTPVVAARRSALPEVCGDAAVLVEPSADGLAAGILTVLTDRRLRDTLVGRGEARAAGFTWQRCAELHAEALLDSLSARRLR